MEDLTKQQIILLSLLLSFVTSIGTGIITFSLLSEAPVGITQTINRVVEKTVERVVPSDSVASVKEVTVKETIVVKEEDLVISAIEKNSNSVVEIKGLVSPEAESVFYGLGILVTKDGLIVVPENLLREGASYTADLDGGQSIALSLPQLSEDKKFAFFTPVSTLTTRQTFVPVSISDSNKLKLGQSAIVLGGKENRTVTLGRIKAFDKLPQGTTTTIKIEDVTVMGVEVDAVRKDFVRGEVLLNLDGEVVGFNHLDETTLKFIPSNNLKKVIDIYQKKPLSIGEE